MFFWETMPRCAFDAIVFAGLMVYGICKVFSNEKPTTFKELVHCESVV